MNSKEPTPQLDEFRRELDEILETVWMLGVEHQTWIKSAMEEKLAEAKAAINKLLVQERIEAIASYKKVNDKLEAEIRIDELESLLASVQPHNGHFSLVAESTITDRVEALKTSEDKDE